ncbi:EAL domain-containing protein [Muricoccus aerilatus]|uniref:EAL domain-containing protein n=1 Tax=Muricoccus aerilatus TaxID=452982 RepID=UPI0012EB70A0
MGPVQHPRTALVRPSAAGAAPEAPVALGRTVRPLSHLSRTAAHALHFGLLAAHQPVRSLPKTAPLADPGTPGARADRTLSSSLEAQAIVRAVAGLGATLRMTTTAEGIETEEQLTALRAMRFDEVQGYLFSRPVPAGQIAVAISACRRRIAAAV